MAQRRGSGLIQEASRRYLLYVLLPAWFGPGLLDWWMHRRTRIEATSGTGESVLHSLMMAEVGLGVLVGLLCDIDAGALSVMAGAALAHQVTGMGDVSFTYGRREIRPAEQHAHSALEMLPLLGLSFAAVMHADQVGAMWRDPKSADWGIRLKSEGRPSLKYLAGLAGRWRGSSCCPTAASSGAASGRRPPVGSRRIGSEPIEVSPSSGDDLRAGAGMPSRPPVRLACHC